MLVPLPNLDDRRWTDLVDEGRALIPVLARDWTDYNEHDPGITLMELFAWFAEGQIYRTNRITDAHRLSFLALLGLEPQGPRSAEAVVELTLKRGDPIHLPAQLELLATGADNRKVWFRTDAEVWVTSAALAAVQTEQNGTFRDLTAAWLSEKALPLLGDDPNAQSALYLGFRGLPEVAPLDLRFAFAGGHAGSDERERIEDEDQAAVERCSPPRECGATPTRGANPRHRRPLPHVPLRHYSASIVWEIATGTNEWTPVDAIDGTRAFTLDGGVRLGRVVRPPRRQVGAVTEAAYYVRARIASGALDAPPYATRVLVNAVRVTQRRALEEDWPLAPGLVVDGRPIPGQEVPMHVEFGADGSVSQMQLEGGRAPSLAVSLYEPSQPGGGGSMRSRAIRVGVGTGAPFQSFRVEGAVVHDALSIYTIEHGRWLRWRRLTTFDRSGAADSDFTLVEGGTQVLFGDGHHGRVPPREVVILAIGDVTDGARGNVASQKGIIVADTPWNAARMKKYDDLRRLGPIVMHDPAINGADAETTTEAGARIAVDREQVARAVTAFDCETLARQTPGVVLARAATKPAHHPAYPCFSAPGFTTLIVVPRLPAARPQPSTGLLAAVSSYVNRRRLIGTRILVSGPQYVEVSVHATVRLFEGQQRARVTAAIETAVSRFLNPLRGGADGTGWPLGRDVFRSEVLKAIDAVAGVDYVISLSLIVPGCDAQCGNVCLPPNALTASGTHRIEVQ